MANKDYVDTIAGAGIAMFGFTVALHAVTSYNIGTLQRMGPGMFPMAVGGVIGLLGATLSVNGFLRTGIPMPDVNWRAAVAILAGVVAFSLMIGPFGLVPAVVALVLLSAAADAPLRPLRSLLLAVALCAIAAAIFKFGLGMSFALIGWPFR